MKRVAYDVICLIVLITPVWVYNLTDAVQPSIAGFFCDDDSIKYPYRNNTVESTVLFVVGIFSVIIFGLATETFLYYLHGCQRGISTFHPILTEFYRLFGYFFVGAIFNQFLTDIGKYTFGRPRPHFLDVCLPSVQCTNDNLHQYISPSEYNCTRTSHPDIKPEKFQHALINMRLSLPSGHSSFAWYFALYLVVYIELRLRYTSVRLLRHFVQLGALAFAMWVSATRIIDFKHRYSDISAGGIVGIVVALFTLFALEASRGRKSAWCSRAAPITANASEDSVKLTPQLSRPSTIIDEA